MITAAPSDWSTLVRVLAAGSFITVVVGLPIAIGIVGSSERLSTASIAANTVGSTAIGTPVRISGRFPLTIDSGRVSSIEPGRGADRRDPASVAIDEAMLTLNLADYRETPTSPATVPETQHSVFPQIAGFASGAIRLTRSSMAVLGPHGTRAEVKDVNATVTVTRKGSYKLVGAGLVNGQRVAIDALWSDAGAREGMAQVPLKLNVRGAVLEATLDGVFKTDEQPSFAGHAEFRLPSLKKFVTWLALGRGVSDQLQSIVVAGPLEWGLGQMSFTRANVAVSGHQATGALTIKHSGERISIDGTLGFQELDLGRQLQGLMARKPSQSTDPHVLTVIDADLRLSASKLQAPGVEMGRAAVSIALNKGRLQADIAELEIESGVAGGQLSIDLNEASPKAGLKLRLKGVDVGRALAEPLRRNPILGKANVAFEGTFGGQTLNEALSSLAGRGHFELAEAGRLGIDVSALVHAAKAGSVVSWAAAGRGGTSVDTLTGRFRVLNGALTIESMQARSGSSVLLGSGRLDVPGRLMDMAVASGPGGAGEAPLGAQDVLLLRGTWESPSISLQRQTKQEFKVEAPVGIH